MKQKKQNKFWIVLLILCCVICCASVVMIQPIGDYLIVVDKLDKADLITAVSGPEYRIVYAAELYKKGLGATLFFTGGFSAENNRSEANWSMYVATITGVPSEAIAINDKTVISTYDEAVLLREFIDTHPEREIHSVIVVTDPYHTRRAKWIYEKVLGEEIKVMMAPVPFSQTNLSKYWWKDANSRTFVKNEYIKFVFYLFRYQWTTGATQEWLSQFDQY